MLRNIISRSQKPIGRTTLGKLVIALLLLISSSVLFGVIADLVIEGETQAVDLTVLQLIQNIQSNDLTTMIRIISMFGGVAVGIGATIVIIVLLMKKSRKRAALFALFSTGGIIILFSVLKLVFARERPSIHELLLESTYSFPSGHASMSCALALTVVILAWKSKWRSLALGVGTAYVILIGFSRMYLAVHYPTDVLAGWLLAMAWVITVATLVGAINWSAIRRLFADHSSRSNR